TTSRIHVRPGYPRSRRSAGFLWITGRRLRVAGHRRGVRGRHPAVSLAVSATAPVTRGGAGGGSRSGRGAPAGGGARPATVRMPGLSATGEPPGGGQVAHSPTPVARMDDVVCTCAGQRLFRSPGCVDAWTAAPGRSRGYVMDLATLWRFA